MKVFREKIELQSKGILPTYIDVTAQVRKTIKDSGIREGIVTVVSPHTTCAVFYEEFAHDIDETGTESLQVDLNNVLEKIIPKHVSKDTYIYPGEEHYRAVESWPNAAEYLPNGDRSALWNGDAHLKATIIGSSETFDVEDGQLGVGTTGYVYFVDFDVTRARTRKCSITVIGE
ncbi:MULTISPECIES: YjbQ family protein [Aerococcus]|uniref:YjbQ family protein n=1 Tax=Aerococcus agrisoli TaxID=2487350 RepID=A0A3N4G3B6_9LACT|nr:MULTISPECIES: YjbQ family protein [Aerococcus]OYQ67951.1 secondary thiamine-phosphate synthase [Aerococcus sp. 1KP-2016]RPA57429.1 YjbQ family protein [Aerococcus agrisoli]